MTEQEKAAAELGAQVREMIARRDPRLRLLLREFVVNDWLLEQATRPGWPIPIRLAIAEDRPAFRDLAAEFAASDDDGKNESLSYALRMVDVVLDVLAGRPEALGALGRMGCPGKKRDWIAYYRRMAKKLGKPDENATEDALSLLCELIFKFVDQGNRKLYENPAGVMAVAFERRILKHLGVKDIPKRKVDRDPSWTAQPKQRAGVIPEHEHRIDVTRLGARDPKMVSLDDPDEKLDIVRETAQISDEPSPEAMASIMDQIAKAELTAREAEAIALAAQGKEGEGIAKAMGVGTSTSETFVLRGRKKIRGV